MRMILICVNLIENDSHLAPSHLCPALFRLGTGEGVALELSKKVGAHSPIPKFFLKLFQLQQNNTGLLLTSIDWDCVGIAWLTVDELWHPLFFLLFKKK